MRYHSLCALTICALSSISLAQTAPATAPASVATPAPAPQTGRIVIPRDTPVSLMAINEVSTAKTSAGARFKMRVNEAIIIDGTVVVPVGTPAVGEVLAATDSGGVGKSGKMTAKLLHISLGEAEIPLEGDKAAKGTGGGSAGIAVIFAGPLGLFHRGNNAKIKAGELLSGFVSEDVTLDMEAKPIKRIKAETAQASQ
jgi:hypothetical protein